jgi:hypothetical protein
MTGFLDSGNIGIGGITATSPLPPANLVGAGTQAFDAVLGIPVYSNGVSWVPVGGGAGVASSVDTTLAVVAQILSASPLNVLPGTYSYAGLPSAASNVNKYATTVDKGAVFSNGAFWQILFNPTTGTLAISSNSPLSTATQSVSYSQTLTATGGIGTSTWSFINGTGTFVSGSNTYSLSSAGVLTTTPGAIQTDLLPVQVSDQSGAFFQKFLALQTTAALTPAATPTFSPLGGSYSSTQTVTISDASPSPTIYYTTNGSTPTTASTIYTTPLSVSVTQTLKAIATSAGLSQSAVGSASYTINAVQNPIFVNFAAGGAAKLEYEAFPTWVDLVRSSRGFNIGVTSTYAATNAAGYPNGTQATITIVLYTGSTTLLARQPWFYNFGTSSYRTFKCSITSGTGLETPTAFSGCTLGSINRPGGGVVTFDLTFDGSNSAVIIQVGTVSTAWTACHCYLPDFPTGGGVGPTSSLTSDCVNHYSQFGGIRFMFWNNAWNNVVHSTAANRNTPSNTVANKGWNDNSPTAEGYPLEWAVDLCIACNCGIWWCLPADAANDYITAVANYLFSNMPVGKPIFIEYSNEVWNGTGQAKAKISSLANAAGATYQNAQFTGTIVGSALTVSAVTGTIAAQQYIYYSGSPAALLINSGSGTNWALSAAPSNIGPVAMTTSDTAKLYSFLAVQLHNIAGIFAGIFTSRYGTDLRMVLGTQQGQGVFLANQTIAQSLALGYTPGTDYHHIAVAPYMNLLSPAAGWTVAQIEANLANTDGSNNPNSAPLVCFSGGNGAHVEGISVQSLFYGGKGVITYESDWQTNVESSSITNIAAAIIDSGMQAISQSLVQNVFNGGATFSTRFESGVRGVTVNTGLGAVDEFDISCANLIAGTSPRLKALAVFFNGATPTRNVVNASGSAFSALNYADNISVVTFPQFNVFGNAPPYNVNGLVPYNVNCTATASITRSLRVRLSNSGGAAAHCDVSIDGVVVITGTGIIPAGASNSLITLGNVTLSPGPHAMLLGRSGTFNASVTVGNAANSGADITWV